uniref:Peptidase C14 caspase domain-containing protein n=1 Tax=Eutreptiella gymnastica TaxID=73025 RepID=A0A6T1ZE55_9EUGL
MEEGAGGKGNEFEEDQDGFAEKSAQAIPGDVRMISGCKDAQTSADVSNVQQFGLPEDAGPGGAGGACTNAFLAAMEQNPNPSWTGLLRTMRNILSDMGYSQIPEMSASRRTDLNGPFEIQTEGDGQKKALIVGINYVGQQGELRGCINDAKSMKNFLEERGFSDFRILTDDDEGFGDDVPTGENIIRGFNWLVEGASAGDSLFFHYSGHGGSVRDDDGNEKDGKDETIIPVDYRECGQIRDDTIMKSLVMPLPDDCQLTSIMDCCHSGTVFDLPYLFTANDDNLDGAEEAEGNGESFTSPINGNFDLNFALKLGMQMFQAFQEGGYEAALQAGLSGFFANM